VSQNAKLLSYLERHNGITTFEATLQLGICRLSERVREIEALGYVLAHDAERTPSGARVIRYRLISVPDRVAA